MFNRNITLFLKKGCQSTFTVNKQIIGVFVVIRNNVLHCLHSYFSLFGVMMGISIEIFVKCIVSSLYKKHIFIDNK